MAYNKYKLFKKQVSYDGGVTWTDVTPLETIASGAPIASYATLEECEAGALYRLYAVVNGGDDYILYCTGLESDAVLGGYDKNYENIPYSTKLNVTSGYVGNCVTKLGDGTSSNETAGVFSRCSGLTNVNMSDSVTEYGDYSFSMCKSLQSVPSSSGLTKIGNYCFAQCSGLTSINIPQTVTSIGNDAFISCSNATSITWPTGTTTVGDGVFHSCFGLTSVTIPSNIIASADNSYGDMSGAFRNCSGLTSCTVNNGIVAQGEFAACTGLRDANLNGVTKIGHYAFNGCINLTGLTLPNTLTSIGVGAFGYCSSLTSITIPDSVTSIGNYAFSYCSGMTTCTIGSGVTSIGDNAFSFCSGLTAITVNATTPPTISNWSFYGTNDCPIYVPAESVNTYKSASGWSYYASRIQAIPTPISGDYLTFVATESGTFKFSGNSINYSLDNGSTWNSLASNTDSPTVESGHTIMWKASLAPASSSGIGRFSSTAHFTVEGNIMSLLYDDNFSEQTSLSGKNYSFLYLFSGCTGMTSAENLSLPATTLAGYCYGYMFQGCTSLTTAPSLPATTLASFCYQGMFNGCTSLTTAPSLPATTLASFCYTEMFWNCTSLTTAPELPATTLASFCYQYMFNGCSNLNSITCLATNISATNCTYDWVNGVASSGTFTKASSMTSWTEGANGIPSGWTVQDA